MRTQGWIENADGVLGNVDVVSDMRAAHERKSPVVNARKARCQNFLSKFIGMNEPRRGGEPTTIEGQPARGIRTAKTIEPWSAKPSPGTRRCQPPDNQRSIALIRSDSSTMGLVM